MNIFFRNRKSRLSVCIHTRNSADRIEKVIAEARDFADQVVVGVDASSKDDTFDHASRHADVAWRFQTPQPGQLSAVRLAEIEYATGDWILQLDDDESMEPTFDALRDELMKNTAVTHHYLARKAIVSLSPPAYIRAGPWYPDWQLRLFRNDRSLVWSPLSPHEGHQVAGPGNFELRTSILHFEPLLCTPEQRAIKHQEYREVGSTGEIEKTYVMRDGLTTEPVALRRPARSRLSIVEGQEIYSETRRLQPTPLPGWRARILSVKLAPTVASGTLAFANVWVRNQGRYAWRLHTGRWPHVKPRLPPFGRTKATRAAGRFPLSAAAGCESGGKGTLRRLVHRAKPAGKLFLGLGPRQRIGMLVSRLRQSQSPDAAEGYLTQLKRLTSCAHLRVNRLSQS